MSLRDFILRFMPPRMRADAETESRKWVAACPRCQRENSVWDVGGIRYKAAGRPTMMARCPDCGKAGPHRFEKIN